MTYKLTIGQDYDTERPDENSLAKLISFSGRHSAYERPDEWLSAQTDCEVCEGDGWERDSNNERGEESCTACDGYGHTVSVHSDVLATLSYYEHGLCRWMVGDSVVPDHGGFDTVQVAGVLVWNGEDTEREWWDNELDDESRRKILEGIAAAYTDWSNGECYHYFLEQLSVVHDCPNCKGHLKDGDVNESCGGFIGVESLVEDLRETLAALEINFDEVTIGGEFGYVLDNAEREWWDNELEGVG